MESIGSIGPTRAQLFSSRRVAACLSLTYARRPTQGFYSGTSLAVRHLLPTYGRRCIGSYLSLTCFQLWPAYRQATMPRGVNNSRKRVDRGGGGPGVHIQKILLFKYFGQKNIETGPNCSHELVTFLKHHISLNTSFCW